MFFGTISRIRYEVNQTKINPPQDFTLDVEDDNFLQWKGVILGPEGTPYEGGNLKFYVELSERYPMKRPIFYFDPPLYHLNVNQRSGQIYLYILDFKWSSKIKLREICEEIIRIIKEPDPSISNDELDSIFRNRVEYDRLAREWTQHNAMP